MWHRNFARGNAALYIVGSGKSPTISESKNKVVCIDLVENTALALLDKIHQSRQLTYILKDANSWEDILFTGNKHQLV